MKHRLARHRRAAFGLALALAPSVVGQSLAAEPVTDIVELFTSQGCTSCPPADEFAEVLAGEDGLLVLAWHVDYWDYLGWKDTLGLKDATRRQKTYAMTLGNRRLVTPQFVVNGAIGIEGARIGAVREAIGAEQLGGAKVDLETIDGRVRVTLSGLSDSVDDTLVELLLVTPETEVAIERGENAGRTITYRNAVRKVERLGMWSGGDKVIDLPPDLAAEHPGADCIVLVRDLTGDHPTERILAAGILPASMLN